MTREQLEEAAVALRARLERVFSEDTALPGTEPGIPSAGHCAAVALLVERIYGAQIVSATVDGQSHWFNRFQLDDGAYEVDLTGDQFGLPPVQISERSESLYPLSKQRHSDEANEETVRRAVRLGARAGIQPAM